MRMNRIAGAALLAAMTAACVPGSAPPAPAPTPAPRPAPVPPHLPEPRPAPPPTDWQDGPLSPGDWTYRRDGAVALAIFASDPLTFTLRCEPGRSVTLWLTGIQAPGLVIRTSYGERRLPAVAVHLNEMQATLAAGDALLDQIAFSRGRFLVQAGGGPSLVVPAWPEIARVTEDCRE